MTLVRSFRARRRSRRFAAQLEHLGRPEGVSLPEASILLGISESQLIRDIKAGCPVVRRGARGRGRRVLIDPAAVASWRARASSPSPPVDVVALSAAVPQMLADALYQAFTQATGPHKTQLGAALPLVWYAATTGVLDMLRARGLQVPELKSVPEKIDVLSKITRANE